MPPSTPPRPIPASRRRTAPTDPPALGASVSGEVTVSAAYPAVNTVTVDVEYFGGDGVYSYAASSPAPTPDEGGGTP